MIFSMYALISMITEIITCFIAIKITYIRTSELLKLVKSSNKGMHILFLGIFTVIYELEWFDIDIAIYNKLILMAIFNGMNFNFFF